MGDEQLGLIEQVAVMSLGRSRKLHREKLTIEDSRIVLRTRCGLDIGDNGFTATFGIPTCADCEASNG